MLYVICMSASRSISLGSRPASKIASRVGSLGIFVSPFASPLEPIKAVFPVGERGVEVGRAELGRAGEAGSLLRAV